MFASLTHPRAAHLRPPASAPAMQRTQSFPDPHSVPRTLPPPPTASPSAQSDSALDSFSVSLDGASLAEKLAEMRGGWATQEQEQGKEDGHGKEPLFHSETEEGESDAGETQRSDGEESFPNPGRGGFDLEANNASDDGSSEDDEVFRPPPPRPIRPQPRRFNQNKNPEQQRIFELSDSEEEAAFLRPTPAAAAADDATDSDGDVPDLVENDGAPPAFSDDDDMPSLADGPAGPPMGSDEDDMPELADRPDDSYGYAQAGPSTGRSADKRPRAGLSPSMQKVKERLETRGQGPAEEVPGAFEEGVGQEVKDAGPAGQARWWTKRGPIPEGRATKGDVSKARTASHGAALPRHALARNVRSRVYLQQGLAAHAAGSGKGYEYKPATDACSGKGTALVALRRSTMLQALGIGRDDRGKGRNGWRRYKKTPMDKIIGKAFSYGH